MGDAPLYRTVFLLAGVAGVAGCGHGRLVPADAANLVPGTDAAAVAIVDGLRCTAESAAWEGKPDELPSSVAPIKVRIRNDSDRPVRVRYQDFALLGASGRRYRPLPLVPREHDGDLTISPLHAADKFFVAPLLHDVYPELLPWSNPLPRDEALYDQDYAKWGHVRPDRHVLREGMPEGMLDAGGSVTGFLYFENPTQREGRATFEAELARGGDDAGQITTIKIPFRVE
jgi:hypothetical protein